MYTVLVDKFLEFGSFNMELLLWNIIIAVILTALVFIAYRLTYTGTAFSKKFMISLGMMTMITTIIMNVISNNLALSLGMVGALSIVRFRTAVKDVRDTTYIFWCIGIGICCGVSMYVQAIIGSVAIMIFLLIMGQVKADGKFLLIIKSSRAAQEQIAGVVKGHFENAAVLKVRTAAPDSCDMIYEMSKRALDKSAKKKGVNIVDALMSLQDVTSVDMVQQTDDISR